MVLKTDLAHLEFKSESANSSFKAAGRSMLLIARHRRLRHAVPSATKDKPKLISPRTCSVSTDRSGVATVLAVQTRGSRRRCLAGQVYGL
jgi:hypothetical protein